MYDNKNNNRTFCPSCRQNVTYTLKKSAITKTIRNKKHLFYITTANCSQCGAELGLPGLIDCNIKEIDEQYRQQEHLVTIEDINHLMKIYHMGKAPLSLALGFGEITISRYLDGQMPSKEYSDIILHALKSPSYMKQMLLENKNKLADSAFRKAMHEVENIEKLFTASEPILASIDHLFKCLREVTPLMLQKLLYFSQGLHLALYNSPIFEEDCQAWIHGPVYPDIYKIFKEFKYNPIDDDRFAILHREESTLSTTQRHVVELVANTFGVYGGKTLETITHSEDPWKNARANCDDTIPSKNVIEKSAIECYYDQLHHTYDLSSENGINHYIHDILSTSKLQH